MLRSRGNRLPSERLVLSLSFCRACCLSLSRTPSVSPLSPRRLARLSAPRTSPIHPLTLSLPPSLSQAPSSFRVREKKIRQDEQTRFPFFPLSGSSLDRLYRPVDSPSARSVAGCRRSPLPVHPHTHTHPSAHTHTSMHCSRGKNRTFFRPRFLADFIPIPPLIN